jgi:hypothetical protein
MKRIKRIYFVLLLIVNMTGDLLLLSLQLKFFIYYILGILVIAYIVINKVSLIRILYLEIIPLIFLILFTIYG